MLKGGNSNVRKRFLNDSTLTSTERLKAYQEIPNGHPEFCAKLHAQTPTGLSSPTLLFPQGMFLWQGEMQDWRTQDKSPHTVSVSSEP